MRREFIDAMLSNSHAFDIRLSEQTAEALTGYYELVKEHNPLLHLVAPCSPEEFAVRHVLESLALTDHLPQNAAFADIGTGAGLPSIPCLIARSDLTGYLIESKQKKVGFLQKVLAKCELEDRATVINCQFAEVPRPDVSFITSRALDRFTQHLPRLVKWSAGCTLLFFGGPELGNTMRKHGLRFTKKLLPLSEKRYLFVSVPPE